MRLVPDLLTAADGSTVSAREWPARRRELGEIIISQEYGGMPTTDLTVSCIRRTNVSQGQFTRYQLFTTFAGGQELPLTLSLWLPPGDGPFPVLLDIDGCWRYLTDDVVGQILARGYIAASFDRTEAVADNKTQHRETGLYRLFPDADFGALSAWAWGCHRCIDALTSLDVVRADAIAVTGHSRGGKAALLAGATDERIAITNPNCSGIGGTGLHRLKGADSERVHSFVRCGTDFWFGKDFGQYVDRDGELPYDQHMLLALVAPRGLLVTNAYEDHPANPPGAYAACRAARDVYDLLGTPDTIGWCTREGGHSHLPADYVTLLDFMDARFRGLDVSRNFQRRLYPDLGDILQPA